MTKHRRPKKPKASPAMPAGANWQRMQFELMTQFYLAGQHAARVALEKAPDCHKTCTTNAMLSFYLGALMPAVEHETDLPRLASLILPRIVESIAIVSGVIQPHASACPPSHDETLN
jgi:hypothetical protein